MKYRFAFLLAVCSLLTVGCAQMHSMMSSDDTAGLPELTEPALPDK